MSGVTLSQLQRETVRLPSYSSRCCIWNGSCVSVCAHLEKSSEENPLCFPDFLQQRVQITGTVGEILRYCFLAPILKCNPRKWHLVIKYLFFLMVMKFYTLHFFHNLFMKDKPGKKNHVAMVMMAKRILLILSVLLILSDLLWFCKVSLWFSKC